MARASIQTLAVLLLLMAGGLWLALPRPLSVQLLLVCTGVGAILLILGYGCARRYGRGAEMLRRWFAGEAQAGNPAIALAGALAAGAILGGLLLAVMVYLLAPWEPQVLARLHARAHDPAWRPLALAGESSVLEEFLFRLFLMSLLVWLLGGGWSRTKAEAPRFAIGLALVLSAGAFAAVHLPPWFAQIGAPAPLMVALIVALNFAPGLAFGAIYWRYGIEAALVCHFAADMMVQGIGPRLA